MATVKFSSLAIGEEFFDHISGESMKKVNEDTAEFTSGGDAFEGKQDQIYPNELVDKEPVAWTLPV